ncbi:hypothetical protein HPB47_007296, partial [Ixodes persulcatus]
AQELLAKIAGMPVARRNLLFSFLGNEPAVEPREKLFDLCGTPGIDMDPTGKNSAIRLVADQPRKRIRSKCTFNVTANNSDGVVISLKTNKLRTAKIVEDICIDYIEFSADSGKTHITVCGEGIMSYDTSVPLNLSVYLNPTGHVKRTVEVPSPDQEWSPLPSQNPPAATATPPVITS